MFLLIHFKDFKDCRLYVSKYLFRVFQRCTSEIYSMWESFFKKLKPFFQTYNMKLSKNTFKDFSRAENKKFWRHLTCVTQNSKIIRSIYRPFGSSQVTFLLVLLTFFWQHQIGMYEFAITLSKLRLRWIISNLALSKNKTQPEANLKYSDIQR